MPPSTTRRAVLTGAGSIATLVAASATTLAQTESRDAALLALREPYKRTLAAIAAVSKPHSVAEDAYAALKAARPDLDERRLRKASGLIPAERAWLRAVDANHKVILEIAERPAHTIAGVIFKAEVSEFDGNAEPGLMESIIADLVAMGGAHA